MTAADIANVEARVFRAIIVNRPDVEGADQPTSPKIEAAARSAGLEVRYVPVESSKVTDEDAAFGKVFDALPKPVLGYCRTGTHTTTLCDLQRWFHSQRREGRPSLGAMNS